MVRVVLSSKIELTNAEERSSPSCSVPPPPPSQGSASVRLASLRLQLPPLVRVAAAARAPGRLSPACFTRVVGLSVGGTSARRLGRCFPHRGRCFASLHSRHGARSLLFSGPLWRARGALSRCVLASPHTPRQGRPRWRRLSPAACGAKAPHHLAAPARGRGPVSPSIDPPPRACHGVCLLRGTHRATPGHHHPYCHHQDQAAGPSCWHAGYATRSGPRTCSTFFIFL